MFITDDNLQIKTDKRWAVRVPRPKKIEAFVNTFADINETSRPLFLRCNINDGILTVNLSKPNKNKPIVRDRWNIQNDNFLNSHQNLVVSPFIRIVFKIRF